MAPPDPPPPVPGVAPPAPPPPPPPVPPKPSTSIRRLPIVGKMPNVWKPPITFVIVPMAMNLCSTEIGCTIAGDAPLLWTMSAGRRPAILAEVFTPSRLICPMQLVLHQSILEGNPAGVGAAQRRCTAVGLNALPTAVFCASHVVDSSAPALGADWIVTVPPKNCVPP